MRKLLIVMAVGLVLASVSLAATFTGQVTDHEGRPLPGATIHLASGTVLMTDTDGRFEVEAGESFGLTHVGYKTVSSITASEGAGLVVRMERSMSMLDNVVVTGNRYEKAAYKVSQPITATTGEQIARKGHTIVSDVIREFPGIDMNDAGPFRARPVIRGLFGTRILVLVDGERLNDQRDISSFAGVSMSLVDANEIDRVEVVNGPSSVLYGSDAMGGVINILTKRSEFNSELTPWARYSSRYSSADKQHSNRIDVGLNGERYTVSFGALYREADDSFAGGDGWNTSGDFPQFNPEFYDALNESTGRNFSNDRLANTGARVNNYDAKFAYKLSNKYRLDFDFGAFRGSDIGYPGVPNDSTPFWFFYPNHDRDNFSVTLTGRGLSDKLQKLVAKAYYQKISKDFLTDFLGQIVIPAGPGMTITPMDNLNHTEVKKYGLTFQELYAASATSRMTFGFDYLREEIDGAGTSRTLMEGFGPFPFIDEETRSSVPKNNWNEFGAYISGEMDLDPLQLTLGLRLDNFWINTEKTETYTNEETDEILPVVDENFTALNGSFGVVYGIGEGVNLVGNLGTAYRVPNVVERFYWGSASSRETRPNEDIKPERSMSFDYGVKAVHDRANYSLMGFYSDYSDFSQLVNYDSAANGHGGFDDLWRYENIEDVTIYGFEAMIEGELESGLYGSLAFTYQHGDNKTEDQPLFVAPIKTSTTVGYRQNKHGLFGEVTLRVVGDQDRVPDVTYLDDVATKGFTAVNVLSGVAVYDQVRLSLGVRNLLDEAFAEPFNARNPDNPVIEPGRSFIVALTASL